MIISRRIIALAAAIVLVLLVSGYAFSTAIASPNEVRTETDWDKEIDKKNDEAAAAKKRQEQLESALEDTDASIIEANDKLTELNEQLPPLQQELKEAQDRVDSAIVQQGIVADKLDAAEAQDEALTKEIDSDNEKVAALQDTVAALARESYKGAGQEDSLSVVFGAKTSSEFVNDFTVQHSLSRVESNALGEVEEIAAINRNRGTRQVAVRDYISDLKIQADELVVIADAARDEAQRKKDAVDALLDQVQKQKDLLETKRQQFIADQKKQEAIEAAAKAEVKDLAAKKVAAEKKAREEAARKKALAEKKSQEEAEAAAKAAGEQGVVGSGFLKFPTKVPYITSNYGMRYHPIFHYTRLHSGTDFRAYCGSPIYAAADGKVLWAEYRPHYGNQVMIDHGIVNGNSVMSDYNHFSGFAVSTGQQVKVGQLLGYSGTTGDSTACHLHFEVYVNGSWVDPMSLLGSIP
ncbi:M23 family metallopeptidase [Demequina aurantiaca]|uniref:M23 family metallopeptidase n=1 Tax=Demequina aurantiaca TaxID=676200 RepID=UPI0007826D8D|nr:M23 family metallopeptidase [Demequina aurantiaca]